MIGFVPRQRPTITVKRYDQYRLALVQLVDRQTLIESIARHLHASQRNGAPSLQAMYR